MTEQVPPPVPAQVPDTMDAAGEEILVNDENVVKNLFHLLEWKSKSDKDMLSAVVKLPAGISKDQVTSQIYDNRQLVLKFQEPEEFASDTLLVICDTDSRGQVFHSHEATICISMKDSCFAMRGGVSNVDPVISYQRIDLPFQVHDSFSSLDVPVKTRVVEVVLRNNDIIRVFIGHMQKLSKVSAFLAILLSFVSFIILSLFVLSIIIGEPGAGDNGRFQGLFPFATSSAANQYVWLLFPRLCVACSRFFWFSTTTKLCGRK
jgi:hypothetical protein